MRGEIKGLIKQKTISESKPGSNVYSFRKSKSIKYLKPG